MNLPNWLTLFRVALIPFFLLAYLGGGSQFWYGGFAALLIFAAASATDAADGRIARKRGQVTNFGKLMDPLADKLLVCAAIVAFVSQAEMPAWVAVLFISREFFVTGLKMLALERREVIAASRLAKLKTAAQMVMVFYVILHTSGAAQSFFSRVLNNFAARPEGAAEIIKWVLIILAAALSVVSAAEYAQKNKRLFKNI